MSPKFDDLDSVLASLTIALIGIIIGPPIAEFIFMRPYDFIYADYETFRLCTQINIALCLILSYTLGRTILFRP